MFLLWLRLLTELGLLQLFVILPLVPLVLTSMCTAVHPVLPHFSCVLLHVPYCRRYVSEDTPNSAYVNLHTQLNLARETAKEAGTRAQAAAQPAAGEHAAPGNRNFKPEHDRCLISISLILRVSSTGDLGAVVDQADANACNYACICVSGVSGHVLM